MTERLTPSLVHQVRGLAIWHSPRDHAGRTTIDAHTLTRPTYTRRRARTAARRWPLALALLILVFGQLGPTAPTALAQSQGDQGLQGGWAVDDAGSARFYHSVYDQLPLMRQAGAGWVRINFRLGGCFSNWTSPGCNGRTALQVYDDVVNRARSQNLQVLGLLSNESWPGGQSLWLANNAEVAGGNGDNAYVQAFAASAAGPVARHFASRIAWWEVWNEPNAWTFRDGAGNPAGGSFLYPSNYAWLLKRSHAALKAARADAVVVTGGLLAHDQGRASFFVGADGRPRREVRHGERIGPRRSARSAGIGYASSACMESRPSGAAYLCDLYVMGRAEAGWPRDASPLDHVGLHLYVDQGSTTSTSKLGAYLQEIRSAYTAYEGGGTAKRIEMTEAGWTEAFVSRATQAQNVRILYEALRGTSYVGRGYWFGVQDIPEGGLHYGLLDGDGGQKPSYAAYQQATTGPPPPPPPAACSPRPRVSVQTSPTGDGRLVVTVTASGNNNWLTGLRFTQTTGASVEVAGQAPRTGAFNVSLPAGAVSTQFWVRRVGGAAATVQLAVVDRCGEWQTFVGGGSGAGF